MAQHTHSSCADRCKAAAASARHQKQVLFSSVSRLRTRNCSASSWVAAQEYAAASAQGSSIAAGTAAAAAVPDVNAHAATQPCATGSQAMRCLLPQLQHLSVLQMLQQMPAHLPDSGSSSESRAYSAAAFDQWPRRQPKQLHPAQITSLIKKAQGPQQLLQLVEQHGHNMDPIHVSTAYSKLGAWCRDGQAQPQQAEVQSTLQLLEPLMQQQQFEFGTWSLANIIHACYYLGSKHPMQLLLQVFLQPHMVAQAASQDVANVLWAAAKHGLVLQDSELQQLLARMCAQLQRAQPQHIANIIYAVAEMGKQIPDQQLQQLVEALCAKLQHASPQGISNTLYAVAKMGMQLPDQQLQQLVAALCGKLDQAKPQAVANSLLACARFRFMPTQLLSGLEQQPEQRQRLLSAANAQEVANMAWACGELGRKGQLMAALLHRALQLQEQPGSALNARNCCNISWAVAVLDLQQHAQQVLQLAAVCSKQWDSMMPENLQQLYQVHLWRQDRQLLAGESKVLTGGLTQQQLERCRASWEEGLAANAAADKVSQFQQAVFDTLQRLPAATWQQPPALEQPTPDWAAIIDIVAVTASGTKLAIEVDGPWHFVRPGNMLDGPT